MERARSVLRYSIVMSSVIMVVATAFFIIMPKSLLSIFSTREEILTIGTTAFRNIALSFIPASFGLIFSVYFQGINRGKESICITLLRQVVLLVPLAWFLHFAGLEWVWLTFPITEVIVLAACLALYTKQQSGNRH